MQVAIIGAGAAGLMAAGELANHGISVEVFEASARVGGRIETVRAGCQIPAELGPEYVHGDPEVTRALAGNAQLAMEPVAQTQHAQRKGRLVADGDAFARLNQLLKDVRDPDESAAAYVQRTGMSAFDAQLFRALVEGFYAAPLDDISVQSVANDEGGDAQQRIANGYDRLIDHLLARIAVKGVRVHLNAPVLAVDWDARVSLHLADRVVGADHAIVTPSIGALRGIAFTPAAHEAPRALLAMGAVVKVVLCMRAPVWPRDIAFVRGASGAFPTYWLRANQLTAWAGGPHASAIDRLPAKQLAQLALDGAARALDVPRSTLADAVIHVHHRDYDGDPFTRGAYSYTRVGGEGAADALAVPVGPLVFAGEATDAGYEGTVAGALRSGKRAAGQVLAAL